jgi:hypothetical protein
MTKRIRERVAKAKGAGMPRIMRVEIFEWHVYVRAWTMCGWELHRCEVNCDTWLTLETCSENFPCHQSMSVSSLYAKTSERIWRIGGSQMWARTGRDSILCRVCWTHKNALVLWQQVLPLTRRCPRLSFHGLEKFLRTTYSGRSERIGWTSQAS